jgi:hypothetical protein
LKTLIFSHTATWPSHHAESIELALTEQSNGREVIYLSCVGSLVTCPANATKKEAICKVCRMQTRYTTSKVLPRSVRFIDLKIQPFGYESRKFDSVDQLKNFTLNNVPFGAMVYSTLTSELEDSFFDTNAYSPRINELLENAIGLYRYGLEIIEKESIDHLYVWNGRRSCDGPLTYAAKHKSINFTTYISGGRYNSILARENIHTVHDVPAAKKELEAITADIANNRNRFGIVRDAVNFFDFASGGRGSSKLNHLGYYQFSQNFETDDKKEFLGKSDKKIIAVFTGTYMEFAGVPGYDDPNGFCKDFYEGVSFLQENIHRIPNAELRIRWHPNSRCLKGNERKKLDAIMSRGKEIENVKHISPDSNFNTYDLIHGCDVAVGFGTSVSVESCLYGKPVIFIGNNMFEGLDCFYKPNSYEELISLLNSPLEVKNFNHALAWGYFFGSFGNLDYKHLTQRKKNLFYYNDRNILSPILMLRRYLGMMKRAYTRTIKWQKKSTR